MQPTSKPEFVVFSVKYRMKCSARVYNAKSWGMWTGKLVTYEDSTGQRQPHTIETVTAHMRKYFSNPRYGKFRFGLFGCRTLKRNNSDWEFIQLIKFLDKKPARARSREVADNEGINEILAAIKRYNKDEYCAARFGVL